MVVKLSIILIHYWYRRVKILNASGYPDPSWADHVCVVQFRKLDHSLAGIDIHCLIRCRFRGLRVCSIRKYTETMTRRRTPMTG